MRDCVKNIVWRHETQKCSTGWKEKEDKIRCSGRVPIATRQLLTRKIKRSKRERDREEEGETNETCTPMAAHVHSFLDFFFVFFFYLCDFFLCNTDTQQTDTETEAGEKRHGAVLTKHLDCTFRSLFSLAGPDEDKWTQKLLDGCKKRLYCRVTRWIIGLIDYSTSNLLVSGQKHEKLRFYAAEASTDQ